MPAVPTLIGRMTPQQDLTRFERFELQVHERRLRIAGQPVAIGARAFDILVVLAERPGSLVGKQTLLDRVWPGVIVEENNLAVHVSQLRKLLGADAIATIAGRGYRLTAALAPDAPTQAPRAEGLPAFDLEPLIGRAPELAALQSLLRAQRWVSLVGPSGVGKSRLARALLQAMGHGQGQGRWLALPEQLPQSGIAPLAAAALDLRPDSATAEDLAAAIGEREVLLVIDNAACHRHPLLQLLPTLLERAPGLRLLVTSQAPLGGRNEWLCPLAPLPVPTDLGRWADCTGDSALDLLCRRAAAAGMRLEGDERQLPGAIELCRTLDGLPLAIELAAARIPMLGLEGVRLSIHDRLRFLTRAAGGDAPSRQHSLRAALECSHALLGDAERMVFRRLAVAGEGAGLALAVSLASEPESGFDQATVVDALCSLAAHGLLAVEHGPRPTRYRLLESPRMLALEQLRQSGEEPALRRRHALAMAAWFDTAYDSYYSGDMRWDDWSAALAHDLGNAMQAVQWAAAAGKLRTQVQLSCTLLRALPTTRSEDRRALAEALLRLAEGPQPHTLSHALRLRLWHQLAAWWGSTQAQKFHAAALEIVALAFEQGAAGVGAFDQYHALCALARAASQVGELGQARQALARACALQDPDWPPHKQYWAVEAGYFIAQAGGDAAQARCELRRVIHLQELAGSDDAIMASNLVDAELALGDAAEAARLGTRLVERLQSGGQGRELAFARVNLLAACLFDGQHSRAADMAGPAWAEGCRHGLQPYLADYLCLLAWRRGLPRRSARLAGVARAAYARTGGRRSGNEARAHDEALAGVQRALGSSTAECLIEEGETWRDHEVPSLALGDTDL
jgi:predicted ATPase/DNA-binding winged helix-turn-helix (wHTH) protein